MSAAFPPGTEPLRDCPACGPGAGTGVFHAEGGAPGAVKFSVRRCAACGLGWTDPVVADAEIGAWYPQAYYGKKNARFNRLFEILVRLFRWRRARVIRRRTKPSKVLDVGCGRGAILGFLKSLGYEPYAVELNEHAAWHARKKGIAVHVGDFAAARYPDSEFSSVIFWHTLEHFRRPFATLAEANRVLKPGGLLVVAVPNSESVQAGLTGPSWFHLDVPRHYFHFGLSSLKTALRASGFKVVQADHFSLEQNPYGWLQSLYNLLGFRYNLLYDILKNRSSRVTPLRRHPFQAAAILALLPALLPASLLLTLVEAALGRGGTIEVYAVKKGPPRNDRLRST